MSLFTDSVKSSLSTNRVSINLSDNINNALGKVESHFNNKNNLSMIQAAQDFRGTFNNFSLEDFILFKKTLENHKSSILANNKKTDVEFNSFMNELENNFYNWSRFFGTESGTKAFLLKNGVFIILFILLIIVFIFKVKNNIEFTPSYLEVFIIVFLFSIVLFIYHRCADYHSPCNILTISGSSIFAGLLCLAVIIHFFILYKKVRDRNLKKKNKDIHI